MLAAPNCAHRSVKHLCRLPPGCRPTARAPHIYRQMTAAASTSSGAVDWDQYNAKWEAFWTQNGGLKPGMMFDIGAPTATLLDVIRNERVPIKGKRAFVPGCGRGYDVVAFAMGGASSSTGLELSETAADAANTYIKEQNLPADIAPRATVLRGDFFTHGATYDVGYDYTFGCALHPDMRKDWAAGWAKSIASGGYLITMIYPVDPSLDVSAGYQGPPWPVSPELYKTLLEPAGFECLSIEPVDPARSAGNRGGKEHLGMWRRK